MRINLKYLQTHYPSCIQFITTSYFMCSYGRMDVCDKKTTEWYHHHHHHHLSIIIIYHHHHLLNGIIREYSRAMGVMLDTMNDMYVIRSKAGMVTGDHAPILLVTITSVSRLHSEPKALMEYR